MQYNFGNPYGYAPQYGQQYGGMPRYQQPQYGVGQQQQPQGVQQVPQPMPTQFDMPIQDIRFVTAEEAKAFIVMPNTKVLLIDRNGMAYMKTADNMGQSQTQYFRFEPVNADGTPIKPQEETPSISLDDFVKLDQLKDMGFATREQLDALSAKLEKIQQRLDGGRNNGAKQHTGA